MTYHVTTYDVEPHAVPEAERRLAVACASGIADGVLAASFHTEIGPLNQVIQIWADAGPAAAADEAIEDLVVARQSDEFVPFTVSPRIVPGSFGPFFEVRRYSYVAGDLPKIVAAWEAALPTRLALGPLVLVASSDGPGANDLLHIWPYRTLDERWQLRTSARETGLWPPYAAARTLGLEPFEFIRMENKIIVPAAFSPLQ
jgi:hypothetical protein